MSGQLPAMSLRGQLEIEPEGGERRATPRRKLRLQTEGASASAAQTQVVIHDLSEEGLLVESAVPLATGDFLEVILPEAGTAQAEVAWTSGRFYGCKFKEKVPTAVVSAALLRSPGGASANPNAEVVEKALIELESLSFAIRRVTKAVDQAIDRLNKKKD